MKTGRMSEGLMAGVSAQLAVLNDMITSTANETLSVTSNYLPAVKGLKAYLPDVKNPNKFVLQKIDFRQRDSKNAKEFDIAIASGNIHQEIQNQCAEVEDYIKSLKAASVYHNDNELKILDSCSRKLVVSKFMGTLIHEMGHNFGLRHNFMASNDVANFWNTEVTGTKHQVRSSSVMEYSSFNEDRLIKPGPYDIAAIRFGYADAVETKDGKVEKLDVNKTIAANMTAKSTQRHEFKFCTDEDVELSIDPMCQRHDAGVTPLEVVRNIIASYQASYQMLNFRRDAIRNVSPTRLGVYRLEGYFLPLLRFYEEWRIGVARYLGQDEQYLERLTAEQWSQVIARMQNDPQFKDFVEQYKPVADHIFTFFMQVASMEDRYCMLRNDKGIQITELSKVREQLFFNNKVSVNTCQDAEKANFWQSQNFKLVTEVGYHFDTFRYDLSPKAATEPMDVIGTQMDRLFAMMVLTGRTPQSYDSNFRGFAPSFMDEPLYRQVVQNYVLGRMTTGIAGGSFAKYFGGTDQNAGLMREYLKK